MPDILFDTEIKKNMYLKMHAILYTTVPYNGMLS